NAMGLDSTEYDWQVLHITSEISKQVFPVTLDLDHPAFRQGMDRLVALSRKMQQAQERGGLLGTLQRVGCAAAAGWTYLQLFMLPVKQHELPRQIRLQPAW
ncbi:MAG: magnesium-protoporphyrin IX monomethyl ester (oxidative) cyclase, partial [Burkholderiaceae bacterium]